MSFALKLFNIQVNHTYYRSGISNDFELIADEVTTKWMERYRMQLVAKAGCFELIWLTENLESPLEILKEKFDGLKMTFYLMLKHPQVISFSAIGIGEASGFVYQLSNSNQSGRLHRKTYVTDADLVPNNQVIGLSNKPRKSIWAVLGIYLNQLWNSKKELSIDKLPIQYQINIQSKSSIWRYHIVDKNNRIKQPMYIAFEEDISYFEKIKSFKKDHTYIYESQKPLALIDKPTQFFSLKTYSKQKSETFNEIVVEKLPIPQECTSVGQGKDGEKIYYSDVFIYV
jgi:hypothetical protein